MWTLLEPLRSSPTSSKAPETLPPDVPVEEECVPDYNPKHFHPVKLGEVFHETYHAVVKLGFGAVSLAKDVRRRFWQPTRYTSEIIETLCKAPNKKFPNRQHMSLCYCEIMHQYMSNFIFEVSSNLKLLDYDTRQIQCIAITASERVRRYCSLPVPRKYIMIL
ncbi:hypothetical protein K503DRAFT_55515 [Rhizopogon vinicolor AM-OR11-026]|uniref:Uncharacterized protein n=1 Tax=Rhizopogon vinicolor AM-OR11-026 TaxID=1314800 RepID=A0A1B7N4J4_9AGAM|nr:hypothetical protein K503DRAFT_55515 [Rhizopogon vinicolor AM-OR11-026]